MPFYDAFCAHYVKVHWGAVVGTLLTTVHWWSLALHVDVGLGLSMLGVCQGRTPGFVRSARCACTD